jgi:hypothetical protein
MAIASELCTDAGCEMLVSPMPSRIPAPLQISVKPKQKRVFFVDSNKPNSLTILRKAKAILEGRGIEVRDIATKGDPSRPMDEYLLDMLAPDPGLSLCGVSDWGSCSSGSSLDAILLQERGATALPVLTTPFQHVLGRVLSNWQPTQPLPVLVLDHPIQNVTDEVLDARAQQLAGYVEDILK